MHRLVSVMKVFEGMEEEYKKRHDNIWPELNTLLKDYGVANYSIHLNNETNQLFSYLEVEDLNKYESLPENELMKKWWAYMEPVMETNTDNSPVSIPLSEVFYLA